MHDIDFSCRRGQTTAIIGSTGSGKSTIAKMLLRLHDVTDGSVRFSGADVRSMTQHDLRERIAYVPQKAWLFSGTIASNLCDGRAGATETEMRHALDMAEFLRRSAPAPGHRPRPHEARGPLYLR